MKMFKQEIPTTLSSACTQSTTSANHTFADLFMAESIDEHSVKQLNENIESLGAAKLGITDIDSEIWAFAQKVVQGLNISSGGDSAPYVCFVSTRGHICVLA